MASGWRLARSLGVLRDEIRSRWPGTTVWTIGDEGHRGRPSDHNPNAAGVVCAIDVLGDGGMNLAWFAARVRSSGHPAVKYVIYNGRIWSKARASEGWRAYHGDNPHTTHVHVSVGVGPDGKSTGPYDDTSPWIGGTMATPKEVVDELLSRRLDKVDRDSGTSPSMTLASFVRWVHKHVVDIKTMTREQGATLAALAAAVGGGDVAAAVRAELDRHRAALVDELVERLAADLADELTEVPPAQVEAAVERVLARVRLVAR